MGHDSSTHRHTPSGRSGQIASWLDFFLHDIELYDIDTGISTCATCGSEICFPAEYGKCMPVYGCQCSIGAYAGYKLMLKILLDGAQWGIVISFIISILCGVSLFYLARRINKAFVLSRYSWREIPNNSPNNGTQLGLSRNMREDKSRIHSAEISGFLAATLLMYISNL